MSILKQFYPDNYIDSTYQIDFERLKSRGIRGVIFDIDNTLVPHGAPADERSRALFLRLHKLKMETMLLSNNKEPRVKSFAKQVHSRYIFKAGKPGVKNYEKAMELMGTDKKSTLFVGDQLFTDVWGAKRTGITSYLVKPIHPKEEIQIVLKRRLEWIVLYFYKKSLNKKKKKGRRNKMKINGSTLTCGLIGNPVEHTLSPVIHNYLAEIENRNLVYVPFQVENNRIKEAVEGAYALNIHGLNITVPYKSAVIPYLEKMDKLAENIGAVNTLVRTQKGYKGFNTDMPGLFRAMETENYTIKGESVILLGAGGAARAVAMLCMEQDAQEIFILNRSVEKAKAVAEEVNGIYKENRIIPMALSDYRKLPDRKYLAIQATSVGLSPNVEDVVITEEAFYDKIETAVDLIYNPYETRFMSMVKAHGGRAMNGLKMLLYQGIIAYELWNDVKISEETAKEILIRMKEELKIHE